MYVRLCENKTTVVHDIDIEKIEEINGFLYNEGQKAVFPAIKTSGIKIITGHSWQWKDSYHQRTSFSL